MLNFHSDINYCFIKCLISANEAMANVDSNYTPPGGQIGNSDAQQMLQNFWPETLEEIRNLQSVSRSNS